MPSLKDLRVRIASVKATQKITKAMQMVAAANLRRAQAAAEAARPYAERMESVLVNLASQLKGAEGLSPLIAGTGKQDTHLLVVLTAERGLAGAFNSSIARLARYEVQKLQSEGKTVKIFCVGRKGYDILRRSFPKLIVEHMELKGVRRIGFANADDIAKKILGMYQAGEFDVATLYYARFKSVIAQEPTARQIIPAALPEGDAEQPRSEGNTPPAIYEYEPSEGEILDELLPKNVAIQIFRALLENQAGELGARMTAMDNATRNAGDMIDKLTMRYNRTRQAQITKELIEIISGAEAL